MLGVGRESNDPIKASAERLTSQRETTIAAIRDYLVLAALNVAALNEEAERVGYR
jgi:hypothetical protein